MDQDLKDLLKDAIGRSGFVVALFLDVRGFSSFAGLAESSEAAIFLKKMYLRVLDDFFPNATFTKPTGDGLMILLDYDGESLQEVASRAVSTSISLVEEFPELTTGDPMINFDVPKDLGIGIARGATTSLVSGEVVIDYSGRPLNLAARLMDLARPRGVVFDSSFSIELLPTDVQKRFKAESVYVRGISESEPRTVYALSGITTIPDSARRPMARLEWVRDGKESMTLAKITERSRYRHPLSRTPYDANAIVLHTEFPGATKSGQQSRSFQQSWDFPAEFVDDAGAPKAIVDYRKVVEMLSGWGVKRTWKVDSEIRYQVVPEE